MVSPAQAQMSLPPFRGLRSFSKGESELFFGREGQSDELARKLGQRRFVAVVGTSGSGKSSLVRAGLLPCLDSGCLLKSGANWHVVDMRPGSRPIEHLADALDRSQISEAPVDPQRLRSSSLALISIAQSSYSAQRLERDENLLILVDQFEELFRYKTQSSSMLDRDEKAAFVKLLLESTRQHDLPVYVAITMRSEFLGDCARFRDLPEAINAGQYLIPRMSRDQRRQAIECPIRMAGADIAPRLVQRILNEVGEDPGQLPVMQHALLRTWIHSKNTNQPQRPLDFEDYEAVGALDKAVSNHADEIYREVCRKLPERGATIVKRLFQRLSDRDQYGRETRRPTPMQELAEVSEAPLPEIEIAVDCFRQEGRNFLSTPDERLVPSTEVDVTHECLLTNWDKLRKDWNPEEDESRRAYLRISTRALESVIDSGAGAESGALSGVHFRDYLTGVGLDRSLAWWNQRQPNAPWARRYIREDRKPIDAAAQDSQYVLAHRYLLDSKKHARTARYWRVMSVLAFISLAVIAVAVRIYRQKSERATANELLMRAELASSVAPPLPRTPKDDPRVSAFRAAESLKHHATLEAQTILTQALFQLPQPLQTIQGRKAAEVAFSPDGAWLAVAGEGGIDLYDAKNGTKSRSFEFEGSSTGKPKLLFPGDRFFMVAIEKKISISMFDEGNWKHARDLECARTVNRFAADGAGTLVVAECGGLQFWTPSSTKSIMREEDCPTISVVALSFDGSRVAYVCQTDHAWTIRSREVTPPVLKDAKWAISPPTVLLALRQKESSETSIPSGRGGSRGQSQKAQETWFSPEEVRGMRFDPIHSDVLLIAGSDGTVRSWSHRQISKQSRANTWTGRRQTPPPEEADTGGTALYRSEGYKLLTMPANAEILSFSEDGNWIAVADSGHVVKVWDTSEISPYRLVAHLSLGRNLKSISISRRGRHIAGVTDDGLVHLWRLDGKRVDFPDLSRLQAHGSYVITHSLIQKSLLFSSSKIIDTSSGEVVASFPDYSMGSGPSYLPLAISIDGTSIAGITKDAIEVHEFSHGKIGKRKWRDKLPDANIYVTSFGFSPDNHYLIGPFSNRGKIWLSSWDVTKSGTPVAKIDARVGDSYEFLTGTSQVYIANPKSGARVYNVASNQSMPLTWGRGFANFGFTDDGKTVVGIEMEKSCNQLSGAEPQQTTGQDAASQEIPETLVRILNPANGQERTRFEIRDYCVQNIEISKDSRYLLTLASTPADLDHPTVLQLWDLAANPPAQKAEIRNGAPLLDAGITPDLRIALLDRKRFAVTPWREEDLKREFCSRLTPDETEKKEYEKEYNQLCFHPPQLPTW